MKNKKLVRQPPVKLVASTLYLNRQGKTGTKEWSDFSYNICRGCEHNCLYCYAKSMGARFDPSLGCPGIWQNQQLNPNRSQLGAEVGARGGVMFPTTHDLTPNFADEAVATIKNLLRNNHVLIVTKPHLTVVQKMCRDLADHQDDILFRFTVGALDHDLCAYWEPGAPPPLERIKALEHAFGAGFATSVSVEPMLDSVGNTIRLVKRLEQYVTDAIWIGKMQRIPTKINAHVPGFHEAKARIKHLQRDEEILRLVELLGLHPKIKWKDSVAKLLAKHN